MRLLDTFLTVIVILIFGLAVLLVIKLGLDKPVASATTQTISADEIQVKQTEMLDTAVLIQTSQGSGSGTIIDCLNTDTGGIFEYIVLTNAHVVYTRFITTLHGVDSLTSRVKVERIDTGCDIIVFDHEKRNWFQYSTTVIAEDMQYDLALLSFHTERILAIVQLADSDMLDRVRVFDKIFVIGCPLGCAPLPTTGIISQIITGNNGEKEWVIYGNTAQVTPGSSGGGLFKQYEGHYYLIGIPFRVTTINNGQIIPHLSHAISIETAMDFISQNAVSYP